jgi:hypothetical protein
MQQSNPSSLNSISSTSYQDFIFTAIGTLLSIPLSRIVPQSHRYTPLLVLGSIGGLADFYSTEARLDKIRKQSKQHSKEALD